MSSDSARISRPSRTDRACWLRCSSVVSVSTFPRTALSSLSRCAVTRDLASSAGTVWACSRCSANSCASRSPSECSTSAMVASRAASSSRNVRASLCARSASRHDSSVRERTVSAAVTLSVSVRSSSLTRCCSTASAERAVDNSAASESARLPAARLRIACLLVEAMQRLVLRVMPGDALLDGAHALGERRQIDAGTRAAPGSAEAQPRERRRRAESASDRDAPSRRPRPHRCSRPRESAACRSDRDRCQETDRARSPCRQPTSVLGAPKADWRNFWISSRNRAACSNSRFRASFIISASSFLMRFTACSGARA